MENAIQFDGDEISASVAKLGYYFCPECRELVYLRKPKDKAPYFYHYKYIESCSLSVKSKSIWSSYKQLVNDAIKILQTDYRQRWIDSIDILIKYDSICLLENKEWAINPIKYYLENNINRISKETFYQFLILLLNFNDEKIYMSLFKLIELNILNNHERNILWEKYFMKLNTFSRELFTFIINTENINHKMLFQLIYKKMGNFEYNHLLKNKMYENLVLLSLMLRDFNKTHDEIVLIEKYNEINNKYKSAWSESEKMLFYRLLNDELKKYKIRFKNNILKKLMMIF
jgi:hypothetical protein